MAMGFVDREGNMYGESYRYFRDEDEEKVECAGNCGKLHDECDVYGNAADGYWCDNCAKAAYTDKLGRAFIYEYELSGDYLDYMERPAKGKSLRAFCLEDMETWVEFLSLGSGENISYEYAERTAV